MEGPTPVSALIHAATMVSAGVYLLVRMFPIYEYAGEVSAGALGFVGFIGAFTALFAATIALAQWDIKRVLAYSTISQLGYMVAAIGMGAHAAAIFHLLTHASSRRCSSWLRSVIHGVEHGFHHAHEHGHGHDEHGHAHGAHVIQRQDGALNPEDPQDMRNMGGLLGRMPALVGRSSSVAWRFPASRW
ncbi:MAG: proton-conducting transporter membrane subunit [Caldilineaceae bacterium]